MKGVTNGGGRFDRGGGPDTKGASGGGRGGPY